MLKRKQEFFAACAAMVVGMVICLQIFYAVLYPIKYSKQVERYAAKHLVDYSLVLAVINTESRFKADSVSRAGAVGLMQLMPATAQWLAQKLEWQGFCQQMLTIPEVNIELGVFYLSYLLARFENEELAVAAYNAGEGTVSGWIKEQRYFENGRLKNIPYDETRGYVAKVLQAKRVYDTSLRKIFL